MWREPALTVLSQSAGPEALSRPEEGVWLLFSDLVKCCNVDQVELQKDHCQSRNDIIATRVIL